MVLRDASLFLMQRQKWREAFFLLVPQQLRLTAVRCSALVIKQPMTLNEQSSPITFPVDLFVKNAFNTPAKPYFAGNRNVMLSCIESGNQHHGQERKTLVVLRSNARNAGDRTCLKWPRRKRAGQADRKS